MKTVVLEPHGFCAGVQHALALAVGSLSGPIYGLHELVHNELVVEGLRRRGMVFVEDVDEVPEGATVLFSAHGVSPEVRRRAAARKLRVIDATCPFVAKVHRAARGFSERGLPVIVIGNRGHAEVQGILGEIETERFVVGGDAIAAGPDALPPDGTAVGVISQTTMNSDEVAAAVAELSKRYRVETMAEVCNATRERQEAVKRFAADTSSDGRRVLLVLGSRKSANTRRLCEVAESAGVKAMIAGDLDEVKALAGELAGYETVALTSGASTPESFMDEVKDWLACPR